MGTALPISRQRRVDRLADDGNNLRSLSDRHLRGRRGGEPSEVWDPTLGPGVKGPQRGSWTRGQRTGNSPRPSTRGGAERVTRAVMAGRFAGKTNVGLRAPGWCSGSLPLRFATRGRREIAGVVALSAGDARIR